MLEWLLSTPYFLAAQLLLMRSRIAFLASLLRDRMMRGFRPDVTMGIQAKIISWKDIWSGKNHITRTMLVTEMK